MNNRFISEFKKVKVICPFCKNEYEIEIYSFLNITERTCDKCWDKSLARFNERGFE